MMRRQENRRKQHEIKKNRGGGTALYIIRKEDRHTNLFSETSERRSEA